MSRSLLALSASLLSAPWASALQGGLPPRPTADVEPPRGYSVNLIYDAVETALDGDAKIHILRSPTFVFEGREVRATWAVLWTDPDSASFFELSEPADLRVSAPAVQATDPAEDQVGFTNFDELLSAPELEPVRELYLEGPVEFYDDGVRFGFADALYVDRVEGHGWLSNAQIEVRERVGGSRYVFKVQSEWLRISSDGSLVSNSARITTCEHADPHYFIRTKQLRMEPTGDPEYPWEVELAGNGIRFGDAFTLPLPPINYIADEEGEPSLAGFRVGDSGQFGPSVGFGYTRDVEGYGSALDRLLKGDEGGRFDSKFRVEADYLGSRGLLLDLSARLESEGRYRWESSLAVIPDDGDDNGLVQVPTEDRDTLRAWFRSRGRFFLGDDEWLDVRITDQTDPGIQAEFFEREYLYYEERENFLHWRKAAGADYLSASLVASLDEFQTTVEELPELDYVRQRTTLLDLESVPLVYSSATKAGWYRRQEGDPAYEAPFADGFGERSTWRLDSEHRFEAPIDLELGGLRLIPFTTARWTGWSEAGASEDSPMRTALFGGARLTTTLWRRTAGGGVQEIAPLVGWSTDAVFQETGGEPLELDATDDLVGGQFLDLGLRGRTRGEQFFGVPVDLDGEVRGRYGADLSTGESSRWMPVQFLGELRTELAGIPLELRHDSRLDVEERRTLYSRTGMRVEPLPRMMLDLSFAAGRNDEGEQVFEAASVAGIYRFSRKWEFEGQQVLNLDTNNSLDVRGIVRRYGHDLIVEVDFGQRAGEGGPRFGISVSPAITASRREEVRAGGFGLRY